MSLNHSPSIVANGLVLYLDAANRKSYPGSGTTWIDLSGNKNNGTLVNSPSYGSDNGGNLVFNGTTQWIKVGTNLDPYFSSTAVTLSVWVYPTQYGQIVDELAGSGWHDSQIDMLGNGTFAFRLWNSTASVSSLSYSLNNWYNLVLSYNGTTKNCYVNGVLVSTQNESRATPYYSGYAGLYYALMTIDATSNGITSYGGGKISTFMVYNRQLGTAEVQQNFNALRGRYGI